MPDERLSGLSLDSRDLDHKNIGAPECLRRHGLQAGCQDDSRARPQRCERGWKAMVPRLEIVPVSKSQAQKIRSRKQGRHSLERRLQSGGLETNIDMPTAADDIKLGGRRGGLRIWDTPVVELAASSQQGEDEYEVRESQPACAAARRFGPETQLLGPAVCLFKNPNTSIASPISNNRWIAANVIFTNSHSTSQTTISNPPMPFSTPIYSSQG
jgi:hypothetical protein